MLLHKINKNIFSTTILSGLYFSCSFGVQSYKMEGGEEHCSNTGDNSSFDSYFVEKKTDSADSINNTSKKIEGGATKSNELVFVRTGELHMSKCEKEGSNRRFSKLVNDNGGLSENEEESEFQKKPNQVMYRYACFDISSEDILDEYEEEELSSALIYGCGLIYCTYLPSEYQFSNLKKLIFDKEWHLENLEFLPFIYAPKLTKLYLKSVQVVNFSPLGKTNFQNLKLLAITNNKYNNNNMGLSEAKFSFESSGGLGCFQPCVAPSMFMKTKKWDKEKRRYERDIVQKLPYEVNKSLRRQQFISEIKNGPILFVSYMFPVFQETSCVDYRVHKWSARSDIFFCSDHH